MYLLALLFFPGTLIHELAHMFMAALLFVRVGKIELFPQRQGESIKLGSVAIAHTDPFRRALIGLAPLFVGLLLLWSSIYYFGGFPLQPWYVNIMLLVFCIFELANTMFSSKRDVEGIPALLIVLFLFILAAYFLGIRLPQSWLTYFASAQVNYFLMQLIFYLSLPLILDGILLAAAKILTKKH
jgi:hypothetical protein